jgi:poly(3-hydroxybutyrate) depolymerase
MNNSSYRREKGKRVNIIGRSIVSLFVMVMLFSGTGRSQSVDEILAKFHKRYHTYGSTTLPYHVFIPDNYDSSIHYPMVLCLHGAGEKGDNDEAVKKNKMATVWALDANQARWPCVIVVPQCPLNNSWTDIVWSASYRVDDTPISNELLTVSDILDSLERELSIDTNRVYITGLSMGGLGTWDMIVRYPNRFAAAIPMCGVGDTTKAEVIKHIPIWNSHGAVDNTVPVIYSRVMISALEKSGRSVVYTHCKNGNCTGITSSELADSINAGAKLLYSEYMNVGHSVWDSAYTNPLLLPWVFSQSKSEGTTDLKGIRGTSTPEGYTLFQNYPNPFNPTTSISYTLPKMTAVSLTIFDILGREVTKLVEGVQQANTYSVEFHADDLSSGIYFYELRCGESSRLRKMMVVK